MTKKNSSTRWIGYYISEKVPMPGEFSFKKKKIGKDTVYIGPTFDLLKYKAKGFDIDRIRMAVVRAKQDYGKAFEKLAAED